MPSNSLKSGNETPAKDSQTLKLVQSYRNDIPFGQMVPNMKSLDMIKTLRQEPLKTTI